MRRFSILPVENPPVESQDVDDDDAPLTDPFEWDMEPEHESVY